MAILNSVKCYLIVVLFCISLIKLKLRTIALISHAGKVMLKILQARLQQYVNHELPDKKQESSRKTSISALLTMPKPLTVWITINCGKF